MKLSFWRRAAWPVALACGLLAASAPARAATLSGPVNGWASGVPSYVSMYEYVPAKLASPPAVVVAAHYCGGSASAFFSFTGVPAIVAAADKYGFIMIFPQTTNPATSAKCWDVGSKESLTHQGGGDTQAIAEMVKYEVTQRGADANRVYILGASSGAMLTEAMLAVYPDVFKAGAEFSGVPAGCWSDGWSPGSNWGGICATGGDIMTAQQWGDLVRGMFPGYAAGYRPRIQLWHGTADGTINYNNQTEAIKEWTNVLGLSTTPSSTDTTSTAGFTIQKWQNTCGFTVLEAHTQAGGGHTTPIDANSVVSFFGLDKTGPDPQVAACGGSDAGAGGGSDGGRGGGGGGGGGGASGNGGSSGSGGEGQGAGGAPAGGSGGATSSAGGGSGLDGGASGGCGCTTAGTGTRGGLAIGLVAVSVALARRSRRRRS